MRSFKGLLRLAAALLLGAVMEAPAQLPPPGPAGPGETLAPTWQRIRLPILDRDTVELSWRTGRHDFFFRLPEHVSFRPGSALSLILHGAPELLESLCAVTVSVNDRPLYTGLPLSAPFRSPDRPEIRFALPVAASALMPDWNRVSVRFLVGKDGEGKAGLSDMDGWRIRAAESFFVLVYERQALFPEPRRFPYSLTEEQLLRPRLSRLDPVNPAVALLLPENRRDIHLRGVAVLGACLGRPTYFEQCRVAGLNAWNLESMERNGLVLARRDEVAKLEFPEPVRQVLEGLQAEEGLIAEMILGRAPFQYRWLLVSGADDVGLEKALLTLAHEGALLNAPPNPSVIAAYPEVSGELEELSRPMGAMIRLGDGFPEPDLVMRGLYRSEFHHHGLRLPPGHETGPGSAVKIRFAHSGELTEEDSYLEILLNGVSLGMAGLGPSTAGGGEALFVIPEGLRGVAPMTLTFRAHLDLPEAACDPPVTERAWLAISGDSTALIKPQKVRVDDLNQLQAFLVQDLFLRQTAFVLPRDAGLDELEWLLNLAIGIGHGVAGAPVAWPQACGYGPDQLPDAEALRNRQVLLLGSVAQIPHAMPNGQRLLARMEGPFVRTVYLQGRKYPVEDFEPTLAMVTLFDSPWGEGRQLVAGGGWRGFALPALHEMMTDPVVQGHFYGMFSAMDVMGRAASYDPTRSQPESLADCLARKIPRGLTPEETVSRRFAAESRRRQSALVNFGVFVWTSVLLVLLTCCRVWLMWERARAHRRHRKAAGQLTMGGGGHEG